MSAQLDLFVVTHAAPCKPLTCAFGEPWMGPHPLCDAETDRACQAFAADVAAGLFNEQGYRPREWKAYQKKRATR